VRTFVERALEIWPALLDEMPITDDKATLFLERLHTLRLVQEVSAD
tara:strand:- start:4916 stop:5053 length:138 start_codon:yes stop_codon:yes gene_type:complete